eukprot:SAG11_NODE_17381_length_520_cov_1.016627_1_plen_77_part_10
MSALAARTATQACFVFIVPIVRPDYWRDRVGARPLMFCASPRPCVAEGGRVADTALPPAPSLPPSLPSLPPSLPSLP